MTGGREPAWRADPTRPVDYLLIGHVCVDSLPAGERLGGTAIYAARAARAIGLSTALVTACPSPAALRSVLHGIGLIVQRSDCWTRFTNRYADGQRSQRSSSQAPPIDPALVPAEWIEQANVVHLAPVAGEIRPSDRFRRSRFVGLTVQGLMRSFSRDHAVSRIDPARTIA